MPEREGKTGTNNGLDALGAATPKTRGSIMPGAQDAIMASKLLLDMEVKASFLF